MFFDTHAHLDDEHFAEDREALLENLPKQGIGLLLNPGCDQRSSQDAAALAKRIPWMFAAVGSHPDYADLCNEELMDIYRNLVRENPKVKAIGEIGLDYHYEDVPRAIQQKAFRMQLELARELELPVIIHEREAHEDALNILADFPDVTGVFHCYSGSLEMAKQLVKKGWFIGLTGVLTFKNARKTVEVAEHIPLDRLVLETDCPYLAPVPNRGKRNDPSNLHFTAQKLADLREMPLEEIAKITMENGKRLYRITQEELCC